MVSKNSTMNFNTTAKTILKNDQLLGVAVGFCTKTTLWCSTRFWL